MYRAITYHALQCGLIKDGAIDVNGLIQDLPNLDISFLYNRAASGAETLLNGKNIEKEIRTLEVSKHVSSVSTLHEVREKLKHAQQTLGARKGVVMDGRDIGTVILPKAELKLFMTASTEVRTQRRYDEMRAKGNDVSMDEVRKNLEHRDYVDSNRKESPLTQATDAIVIDNTEMDREEQLDLVLGLAIRTMAK